MAEQTPAPKMTPPTTPHSTPPTPPADKTVKVVERKTADGRTVVGPHEIEQKIPDGAIPMDLVEPGYGPLEGSPKENDPSMLANPNNPLSPVTRPANPSNPANPPQTQSEKPASEQRIFNDMQAKASGKVVPETEVHKKLVAEKLELTKKIGETLAKYGGNESQVPSNDPYWGELNRLRVLSNP
jgi:hypothetical protein